MRGGDSLGIRAYNERLIIDAILKGGPLSKADLARRTGLSANAAMVISNRLIKGGVLRKLDPVRGKPRGPQTLGDIAANVDEADTVRATEVLRRTDRQGVDPGGRHVELECTDRLCAVDEQRHATFVAKRRQRRQIGA